MIKILKKEYGRFKAYIYDQSIDVKDRAFILFSTAVLLALFAAIPCGLIMREPLMATLATAAGTLFFTVYLAIAVSTGTIKQAKMVISVILVVLFLPGMFFTNGGVSGGTPIWLLLGTIYIALILDGTLKAVMLISETVIITACWIIGYFFPELVTEYSRGGNYFDTIAALYIVGSIIYVCISFQGSLFKKDEESKNAKRLFEQTAIALVSAVDAKDKYTHGHSARVAEYARKIAEQAGKSKIECEEIYYVALLHDVGKIAIPEEIVNKVGKLTSEEYRIMQNHSAFGAEILHSITEYPNLSVGAHYHHERYDGKGYPEKLKGEDIPEIARIIAVADAYDAMTSKRSYRDPIPQQNVREEIVKGAGTQFDPRFAKIMQHLIDLDTEFEMQEKDEVKEFSGKNEVVSTKFRDNVSEGIVMSDEVRHISFKCGPHDKFIEEFEPAMILFDSLDGCYHDEEREIKSLNYYEYGVVWFDGRFDDSGVRKIEVQKDIKSRSSAEWVGNTDYEVEAVKQSDHIMIKIKSEFRDTTVTVALPDSSRFAYLGFTGENCHFFDFDIIKDDGAVSEDYIPRIAEKVSYIEGPEGDLPNIQIDGYRAAATEGVRIEDKMKLTFHTKSLPTARLVWHCAFMDIFYSADKKIGGEAYREYALVRLDGESWDAGGIAENKLIVNISDEFDGWEAWKEKNKKGVDVTVTFAREGNKVTTYTENQGISIKNTTTVLDDGADIYVALTGDQCTVTNIRIEKQA